MKKVILALAVVCLLGSAAPAIACEGGKCTMEHTSKDGGKTRKGKKATAKPEGCHMSAVSTATTSVITPVKSCCAKPEAGKAEGNKEVKNSQ